LRGTRHTRSPIVEGLGLHVLRQGQGHRARLGRVGQDAHGRGQRRQQLLGPIDAIPVAAERLEAVVDREVLAALGLELLENGADVPTGEDVAGQQQHRQTVDGRGGRAGEHVGGAGPDRGGAGERLEAVLHPGVRDRHVDLGLLVARLVVAELGCLLQRLANPGHVAVAEDAPAAGKERLLDPVALDALALQERDQRLGRRQPGHAPRR
jgi:hypothetical protein